MMFYPPWGVSNKYLASDFATYPAGPTMKTALVLETRLYVDPESLPRLSPEPVVDCWSRDGDSTLSVGPMTRWKEVAIEPSLEMVSL
jgi:hypothetical protein